MLSFEKKFDIEEVYDLIKHKDESTSVTKSSLKCIGFQTDLILFACNTVVEGKIVTKIGYYCLQEKTVHDLYVHHDFIDVLVASINPEKNLLGLSPLRFCWLDCYFHFIFSFRDI